MTDNCCICEEQSVTCPPSYPSGNPQYSCPRCGEYVIGFRAGAQFTDACRQANEIRSDAALVYATIPIVKSIYEKGGAAVARSIVSHVLRKSKTTPPIHLTADDLQSILANNSLPTPAEQANNLIRFLAEKQQSYSHAFEIKQSHKEIHAIVGLLIGSDLRFICDALYEQKILTPPSNATSLYEVLRLSFAGWQKHEELKRSVVNSRKAFMAMAFSPAQYFKELLRDYLKPAAKQTEYDLDNPLLIDPKAGNIHARMEAEIRTSRFVVAEITDGNDGAYWEAGFAKGLGKPVIYTCKKDVKPHFDVGADYIIFWEEDKPEEAAAQLKAVIRATLFGEAKMMDGE